MKYLKGNIYAIIRKKFKNDILYEVALKYWLQSTKTRLKESSFARYYYLADKYIGPRLGNYFVSEITTATVENYIFDLIQSGRSDGGRLSGKMVADIFSLIKQSIMWCRDAGYQIPCDLSRIRIKKPTSKITVLSLLEQKQLENELIAKMDTCRLGVLVAMYTGLRVGELCALQWADINLEEKIIHVRKTLQRIKNFSESGSKTRLILSQPKSDNSIRDIPIMTFLIPYLKNYQQHEEYYLLSGQTDPVEPRVIQYRFKNYLKECNIEQTNFHTLRHTFATRCIEKDIDTKCLSEILGHSDVQMTLNRYVHTSAERKLEQIQKLKL